MSNSVTTCSNCHGEGAIITIGGSRNTCEECLGTGHTGSPFDKWEPITQTTKPICFHDNLLNIPTIKLVEELIHRTKQDPDAYDICPNLFEDLDDKISDIRIKHNWKDR